MGSSVEGCSHEHDWGKVSEVVTAALRLKDARVAQVAADRETTSAQSAFHESLAGLNPDDKRMLGRVPTVAELIPAINSGDNQQFFG